MNSPERVSSEVRKPVAGYLWGALAVLTWGFKVQWNGKPG